MHEVFIELLVDIHIKQAWLFLAFVEVILIRVEKVFGFDGSWLNGFLLWSKVLFFKSKPCLLDYIVVAYLVFACVSINIFLALSIGINLGWHMNVNLLIVA